MFSKEIFVNRLNELLKENKITKQSLANAIDVKRQAVSQFASGANLPSLEKLVAIAEFFGVTTDYLLGLSDKQK